MKADSDFVVYGLLEPASGQLRYIGCSSEVEKRFKSHLREKTGSKKSDWVQSLKMSGQVPKMAVLETFPSVEMMKDGEKELILRHRSLGVALLNQRIGGEHPVAASKDEAEKKSESFLVRIEKDVHDFYVEEAKRRRIPVAVVLREVLYRHMEEIKKGTSNGQL